MATGGVEYRVYIGSQLVSQAVYDAMETVTVKQEIDLAAEARIELETYANDQGTWVGVDQPSAAAWQRVRIEVRNGTADWIPLIDGPVVKRTTEASGEPGVSTLTIVARDDSAYFNRHEATHVFKDPDDDDSVAKALLTINELSTTPLADKFPGRPPDRPYQFVGLGTRVDSLRKLGHPYDFHFYVLPGTTPNTSQAFLKAIDWTKQVTLPTVVLVGPSRNIETFHVDDDVGDPSVHVAGSLTLDQLQPGSQKSSWSDLSLLGDDTAADTSNLGQTLIAPWLSAFHDAGALTKAQQQRTSLTVTATGLIRGGCYCGVLTPYEMLNVSGVDQGYCTKYVIKEVTHTFTRSEYMQEFTIYTNAYAKAASSNTTSVTDSPPPEVF